MKRICIIIITATICCFLSNGLYAQDSTIAVDSKLEMDEADHDARIYFPEKDFDDNLCALIKVTVINKLKSPLVLEVGGLGVVKREVKENGEIWFYVPYSVKNLSFKCKGYAPLSPIPAVLKSGTVYRLTLRTNAEYETVKKAVLASNYVKFILNTENAVISIGSTPDCQDITSTVDGNVYAVKLDYGTYYYKVEHTLYETFKGEFKLDAKTSDVKVSMKPAYGYLTVNSVPEGASVYVGNYNVGETPCVIPDKLPKGKFVLRVLKNDYAPFVDTVNIAGNGVRQTVNYTLEYKLSKVVCVCDDTQAEIWLDDEYKGVGTWSGYVDNVAQHILESRKDGHKSQSISFKAKPGISSTHKVPAPIPMYGTLDITTTPNLCDVKVDGKSVGTSPVLHQTVAGKHIVELTKDGYTSIKFEVEVEYDNVKKVTKELFNEKDCVTAEEMFALGDKYFFGKRGVVKDFVKAFDWYQKSAAMDYAPAQYALGFCYENGYGTKVNLPKAIELYYASAQKGYPEAQFCIGYCMEKGIGLEKNINEAFFWYKKAADQGHMTAQNNVGYCYKYGKGVDQNPVEAVKWYKKAANQGFPIAQTNLGICYLDGIGVQKNRTEAIKWLTKAAQNGEVNAQKKLESLGVK